MLKINNYSKRYGGIVAVEGVSLTATRGEITSIIGPNGAGKTTLLNLISGVVVSDTGEGSFKGVSITGKTPHELAEMGITRTYQSPQLFETMSVLETIMIGAHLRGDSGFLSSMFLFGKTRRDEAQLEERALVAMDRVGLDRSLMLRPATELAYGLQRRVEIARALAMSPTVLLLDEPAAGLNRTEKQDLSDLIRSIAADGLVVLLVEHDMELVMGISERVFVMNFGQKIAEGTPTEVQENPAVIEAYLGTDAEEEVHA